MDDMIHMAITMTEMDTGIKLSPAERQAMFEKILNKTSSVKVCTKCDSTSESDIFWDSHQTMNNNNIWCAKKN
jgi:hypothetical protein